ncbi:MAG: protein kinase domain-containing protein [Pseudobdellovibrio sp.]
MSQTYEQFGKYLLLEKVAAGGMAEIYLAKSGAANGLNKFFAIKRILPQFSNNEDFVSMFKEEAKVCINLNHSNVVSIFDFGIEQGQFYLVMDYVEGRNLRQIINELKKSNKSFSIDQALYLVKEAAAGLDHAHRCVDSTNGKPLNITHRDMSPQNVMVSFEGEIKVIDFGIAKAETEAEDTKAGTLKGKFSYMSPEQAEGQPIDPRTDVFALGIVLWELLANDRLFTGSNEAAILRKVRDCQVPPIRKINPTVPQELERIVMKALAKDKNVRYQTAANLHRDLNRFLNTQYPDFSPQDFSAFVKDAFKVAYQEARDKLVSYAKLVIPEKPLLVATTPAPVEKPKSEKTDKPTDKPVEKAVDAKETREAKEIREAEPIVAPFGLNSDKQLKVNLDDFKFSNAVNNNSKSAGYNAVVGNQKVNTPSANNQTRVTQVSQVSFGKRNKRTNEGGDILFKVAFLAAIVYGGWWWYKNMAPNSLKTPSVAGPRDPAATNPTVATGNGDKNPNNGDKNQGKVENSSNAQIKVSINSKPDNAEIWLNGKDTGVRTPGLISVAANADSEIILRKDGHLDYKLDRKFTETSNFIATLQQIAPGYVNIKMAGADSFTKISINGKELLEKAPILKYPIVADRETVISAYNPISKQYDEIKAVVKPNEVKDVDLVLGRTQR